MATIDGKAFTLESTLDLAADAFTVDIASERLLRLDNKGGLRLSITVGDAAAGAGLGRESGWTIESLELGVTGRHSGRN